MDKQKEKNLYNFFKSQHFNKETNSLLVELETFKPIKEVDIDSNSSYEAFKTLKSQLVIGKIRRYG